MNLGKSWQDFDEGDFGLGRQFDSEITIKESKLKLGTWIIYNIPKEIFMRDIYEGKLVVWFPDNYKRG